MTLEESTSITKVWDSSGPQAVDIIMKIVEMIVLDCEQFSIVDIVGFIHVLHMAEHRYMYVVPSQRHITKIVRPQIRSRLFSKVKEEFHKPSG